jgi:hypothetical protein
MNEVEKLRILIPHWMEHNDEHAEEYRRWAGEVAEVGAELIEAVEALKRVNQALVAVLEKLGEANSQQHDY